ncbi:DUF1775 domain-containing protein [Streptomyces sp. NPDC052701]|uniref:DUF1775 domain-containing protein n=1 Tax=Streptomyces sp. NPDC052701 TaxID=3155533 RepID=UPI0034234342
MSRPVKARTARRLTTLGAVLTAAVVATAGPASAHTEVEAENARALARNVTLTFSAASESSSAGISKLEVILPEGIAPGDLDYQKGPEGWTFDATGRGWAASGPALAVGEDATVSVTVRQLPDVKELVFKTLQTYSDGRVDRWIELDGSGDGHGHGHPAPKLRLGPAEPGAEPLGPGSPSAEEDTAPAASSPAPDERPDAAAASSAEGDSDDGGTSPAVPLGIGAAVLLAVGGGVWWARRRGARSA